MRDGWSEKSRLANIYKGENPFNTFVRAQRLSVRNVARKQPEIGLVTPQGSFVLKTILELVTE